MLGLKERNQKERNQKERGPKEGSPKGRSPKEGGLNERRRAVLEQSGTAKGRARFAWLFAGSSAVFLAVLGMVLAPDSGSPSSQGVGNVCILLAALIAAASCANAARTRPEQSRAWLFLTIAALVYAAGMFIWTYYGITLNHAYPFPSAADIGFLGYAVPAAIGLFLFPREPAPLVARLRAVLDALVIAGSVLFISWATVLGPLYKVENSDPLSQLTGLAYPMVDVVMASLVLALGMRSLPGTRLPWLCLGGGLLVLALTDSIYVRLVFDGVSGATGTLLALGWVSAFLLMALAPLVPDGARTGSDRREYVLLLELLPYIPVVAAVVVLAFHSLGVEDTFLLVNAAVVLVLVMLRQVLIVFENVTLTRELESKVSQRTAELEGLAAIVNSSADAIIGTAPDGVITSWNPGAERIYGYPAHDVIGKQITFLIPDHLRDIEESFISDVTEAGETRSYETERLRSDGVAVPVSLTMSPIQGDGGIHGIATIAQDITERRLADAQLREAREAALESSRLKSEFLATMSHEIRTPMNGVVGLTALLLETGLDETQRQYAEGVKGAAEALLSLINDILDFSKLEAGKVDLDPAPFDPRIVVEEVAGLLAETAQGKQLELIAYCHPDVPARLLGDSGRIRQVLLNLASNAVKFTPSGEVAIKVAVEEQNASQAVLRFEVRDTGIGIAPGDHERLFESFSQADASTTRRYGGTGLGLAISRRLTDAMGGRIGLASTPGEGSTFWFLVPLPILEAIPAAAAPAPGVLTGLRVLVVDDNATNRLVLESQLKGWRLEPDAVADAPSALERCQEAAAAGRPYDIAVLDMCMPDMNGLELAQQMSKDSALQSTRIIMLTSTMQVNRSELAASGVREWLTKPVRSSEFYDRLIRLMAVAPPPARAASKPPPVTAQPELPSKGRILVVEDNEVNQLVARSMAVRLGYDVDVVADGSQALSATAAVDYLAVLMDCHMPVMDGFEATRAIRARGGGAAALPIIAMTAGAMSEDRERCREAGMDDYLTKPVDMEELEEALRRWAAPAPEAEAEPETQTQAVDPARLAILRELGPEDGMGLLPAAARAFQHDLQPSLDALRLAVDKGGEDLIQAAHKLKGAAANIGANGAVAICQELEELGRAHKDGDPELLARLEAELALVEKALHRALLPTP